MKKYYKIVYFIVSAINAISCIILLSVVCPRVKNIGFDYVGIIVAILALLVTLLIGWNIYSIIDLKNIRRDYERMEKRVGDNECKRKKQISQLKGMVFGITAELLDVSFNRPLQSFEYYVYSLRNYIYSDCNEKKVDNILNKMKDLVKDINTQKDKVLDDKEILKSVIDEIKVSGKLSPCQLDKFINIINAVEPLL